MRQSHECFFLPLMERNFLANHYAQKWSEVSLDCKFHFPNTSEESLFLSFLESWIQMHVYIDISEKAFSIVVLCSLYWEKCTGWNYLLQFLLSLFFQSLKVRFRASVVVQEEIIFPLVRPQRKLWLDKMQNLRLLCRYTQIMYTSQNVFWRKV